MAEQTTETPTTPTEGTTSSEAAPTSLLTGTEVEATPATAGEPAKEGEAAETPKPAEEAKPEGAPESYDFKAPEGKAYDPAVLEPFSAAAKEANLTQDAAQKLLDTMAPKLAERQQEQVKAVQTQWLDASKSDKEFGGEKLSESLAIAKKVVDTYASPELKTLLSTTGLGNNPEVIRLFYKVGKSMSEDGFVKGTASTDTPRRAQDILYDKTGA